MKAFPLPEKNERKLLKITVGHLAIALKWGGNKNVNEI